MSDEMDLSLEEDLDSLLTAESEEVTDTAMFEPDKPFWSVPRDTLLRLLKAVQTFPAKSVIFLALWKEGSTLKLHSNNKDAVLEAELPILNEGAFDTDKVYFLDSKALQTFLQNYPSFAFSFDENANIYFETPYACCQLEAYNMSLKDMRIELNSADINWLAFPLTKFQTGVFKSLFSFAVSMNDNKVLILKDRVTANFTLYQHSLEFNTEIPEEVVIRRIDIPTICEMAEGDLEIGLTKERVYYRSALGIISFLRLPYSQSDFSYPETYASGETVGSFQADIKLLRKALHLSHFLSSNLIEFASEDGKVYLYAGERARFLVGSGELKERFSLSTELFTKIVVTLSPAEVFVDMKVTEKGVDLSIQKDVLTKYSLSRTTVGQQKRKEKIEKKLANRVERKAALEEKGKLAENLAEKANSVDDLLGDEL